MFWVTIIAYFIVMSFYGCKTTYIGTYIGTYIHEFILNDFLKYFNIYLNSIYHII